VLTRLGREAQRSALRAEPWTNVYGLARTLLATGTLLTLLFNPTAVLFGGGDGVAPTCLGYTRIGLFCQVPAPYLEAARWIGIAVLVVVASGWRPRLTALPHWWISLSVTASVSVIDGGDHITTTLTFLLLPLALTDARRWHWDAPARRGAEPTRASSRLIARVNLAVLRLQVCVVYFHAAVGKLKVPEWTDGTAVYYWFLHPSLGLAEPLRSLAHPVLSHPVSVAGITWGALGLEFLLVAGIVMERAYRPWLLAAGMGFHAAIVVVHGLPTFALAMWAALILYLRPTTRPFALPWLASATAGRWAAIRARREGLPLPLRTA